jgi:DNA polymerase sigma
MRVYIPNKRDEIINEVLSDLYLLKQAVELQATKVSSRLDLIDKIRVNLQQILEVKDE